MARIRMETTLRGSGYSREMEIFSDHWSAGTMYKIRVRQTIEFETVIDASTMSEAIRLAAHAPFDERDITDTEIVSAQSVPDHPDRD